MRVGMCTKWIDEPYTGVGNYTRSLVEHLLRLDDPPELHLIHMQRGGDELYEEADREHVFSPVSKGLWWYSQDRFCRGLSGQLDILHEPFVGFRRRMRCAQVVTLHDMVPLMHPEFAPRAFAMYFRYLMPKVVRRADAVICDSRRTAKDVVERLEADRRKVHVVYLGVDVGEVEVRGAFRRMEPYVVALSNTPMKNVGYTIDEFERYKQKHGGDLRLVVVGTDFSGRAARCMDVEVREYLPRARLLELIKRARALLFPSHYEGFGFPPLEAMSLGVPVIASDRGSLPEVLGDAALVADIDSQGSLAHALHRVLSDDGLAGDLVLRGRERASRYSWDRCARETVAVYEGLASR